MIFHQIWTLAKSQTTYICENCEPNSSQELLKQSISCKNATYFGACHPLWFLNMLYTNETDQGCNAPRIQPPELVAQQFTHNTAPVSGVLTTLWQQSPHHSVNCPPGVIFDSRQYTNSSQKREKTHRSLGLNMHAI